MKVVLIRNENYLTKMSLVGKLIYEIFGLEPSEALTTSKTIMFEDEVELETHLILSTAEIESATSAFATYGMDIRWGDTSESSSNTRN
jgi:hypothetical protein